MATAIEASYITFACPGANNTAKAYGDLAPQKPMSARSRQQRNKGHRGRKNRHERRLHLPRALDTMEIMKFGNKHDLKLFAPFT
eukprot:2980545-Pyramimonas_sp.AAC.1